MSNLRYLTIKIFFDRFLALILLLPFTLVILLSCLFVVLNDFGNPFFIQKRLGYKGKEFNVYKIRTMIKDAEKNGAMWAQKNDNRILTIGKFLRKTRIDEFPQLFNILKGEMSWIGPRPETSVLAKNFLREIPNFNDRLLVKPGLTGYAQVNGGYELSPKEKLEFDLFYIKNMSLKLDLQIFLKTIFVIFTGNGAR